MTTLYKNIESSEKSPTDPSTVEGKIDPRTPTLTTLMVACGMSGHHHKDKTAKKIAYKIIIAVLIVVLLTMFLKPQGSTLGEQIEGFTDTAMTLGKKIAFSLRS